MRYEIKVVTFNYFLGPPFFNLHRVTSTLSRNLLLRFLGVIFSIWQDWNATSLFKSIFTILYSSVNLLNETPLETILQKLSPKARFSVPGTLQYIILHVNQVSTHVVWYVTNHPDLVLLPSYPVQCCLIWVICSGSLFVICSGSFNFLLQIKFIISRCIKPWSCNACSMFNVTIKSSRLNSPDWTRFELSDLNEHKADRFLWYRAGCGAVVMS